MFREREHIQNIHSGIDAEDPLFRDDTRTETGLKGFEPLTCGLRVRRYAELSYRPAYLGLIMWSMIANKG